ncbi:MAG: hypothetical protein Hens2KO_09730 [Henriciella sp.]
MKLTSNTLAVGATALCVACTAPAPEVEGEIEPTVIEIATFRLADGVNPAQFAPLDAAVERNHVSQHPGFVSRETGYTDQGEWLVIVHWESIDAAEASMASFSSAPAAADFMASLDATSMSMIRYEIND